MPDVNERWRSVSSDAQLFDLLQMLFGIGDWVEEEGGKPYWRWRNEQIARVKSSRLKRGAQVEDLALTAAYCKATGEDVRAVTWLYKHIPAARSWWAGQQRALAYEALDELIAAAEGRAFEAGEHDWLGRFARATTDGDRREVLDQWLKQHPEVTITSLR